MNSIIIESKLKLSLEEIKLLLKTVKAFSEKKNTSPVFELKKVIEAKKRKLAEKKDIPMNKQLLARNENIKKLTAEKESKQSENKGEEAKNKGQEAKNLIEIKLISEQQKLIKAAKESYQNLSPDLKQYSPEEINTKINALSPNTKARLKKSGLSLSDYASRPSKRWKSRLVSLKRLMEDIPSVMSRERRPLSRILNLWNLPKMMRALNRWRK